MIIYRKNKWSCWVDWPSPATYAFIVDPHGKSFMVKKCKKGLQYYALKPKGLTVPMKLEQLLIRELAEYPYYYY